MLKPTLNNLTIPDSILVLEFIVIDYSLLYSPTLSDNFFLFNKCKKIWQKQFTKFQDFHDCGGPWHRQCLGFIKNHLKLVSSIPGKYFKK